MAEGDFGHLPALPDEIRDIFMWLCQDVALLVRNWETYVGLFGTEDNQSLLASTALEAFKTIEESLRVTMTMTICRLSDGLKSCGKENLNFSILEDFYASDSELKGFVKVFRESCASIRVHRNKIIGHSDLNTKLKPDENLLPPVKRSDVESLIKKATEALIHVARKYGDSDVGFTVPSFMGADALTYWLKKGWEAEHGPGS